MSCLLNLDSKICIRTVRSSVHLRAGKCIEDIGQKTLRRTDNLRHVAVCGRTTLNWILKVMCEDMDRVSVTPDKIE